MNGKTHVATCVALSFGVATILGTEPSYELAFSTALGALIPDVDHPNSILGRRLWGKHIPMHMRQQVARQTHRKFTHYPETWVGFTLLLILIFGSSFPISVFGISIGYFGHLVGDSFTKSGIPSLAFKRLRMPIHYYSGNPVIELPLIFISTWISLALFW